MKLISSPVWWQNGCNIPINCQHASDSQMLILHYNIADRLQCQNSLSESFGTCTKLFTFHTIRKPKLMYFEYIKQLLRNTDTKLAMALPFLSWSWRERMAICHRLSLGCWCGPVVTVEGIRRRPGPSVRAGHRLRVLVRTWAFIAVEGGGVGMGPRRCWKVVVRVWVLVTVWRWWCRCGRSSPFEGGGTGMGPCRRLKVVVRMWALIAGWRWGVGMGVRCCLRVLVQAFVVVWGCWYGCSLLFEGAGAGVGPRRHQEKRELEIVSNNLIFPKISCKFPRIS